MPEEVKIATPKGDENKVAKTKDILANIKLKEEFSHLENKRIQSPHLDRAVSLDSVKANPKLYLKKYARDYVKKKGEGQYPLLEMFDLSEEQITELSKL